MEVNIYPSPRKLSEAVASLVLSRAQKSVQQRGRFTIALCGGSSPKELYRLLGSEPYIRGMPWHQTLVFWGDERFVPADDPENNARMAREMLLNHSSIPSENIFPIPTDGEPETAAESYIKILEANFDDNLPQFDFILLGMGADGHTASLLPGTNVVNEKEKWVDTAYLKKKNQYRITLTAPIINNARSVAFLVYGTAKAEALQEVLQGKYQPEQYPAQLIKPAGDLHWFIDEEAGVKLK